MLRTIPVDAAALGLVAAGQPDAVMVWDRSGDRAVLTDRQDTDDNGVLLWTCYVLPTAGAAPDVLQVRIPAPHQPVVTMLGPDHVDGLEVNVRVDRAGKVAQYWQANGIRDAGQAGRKNGHQEHKQGDHQPA